MDTTDRLNKIQEVLDGPDGDDIAARRILRLLLGDAKVWFVKVHTEQTEPMKMNIVIEIDGTKFRTAMFQYDTGNGVHHLQDDYSGNIMKRRERR